MKDDELLIVVLFGFLLIYMMQQKQQPVATNPYTQLGAGVGSLVGMLI